MCDGGTMVESLLPSLTAHRIKALSQVAPLQERHQANVGRSREHQRRQVDSTIEEEQSESGLGERLHGDVGRTVSGRAGNLWDCPLHSVPGRLIVRLESNGHGRRQYKSNKGRA